VIIHTLISPYRQANSYLIEIEAGGFIGVDIGNVDISKIISIIEAKRGKLLGYFLTHAHGDHTIGIEAIWNLYQMPIYCSESTALDLNNPRKNFSIYSAEIATFKYDLEFTLVVDNDMIIFGDNVVTVISVPGHSPGCISLLCKNSVFTGDFIMRDFKTPLNLPNSCRDDYAKSLEKFRLKCSDYNCTFFPGHGQIFTALSEIF
jgi:glyoxylase-like metal-dependent hydrolase (beta-lactamase superfamily II)